MADNGVRIESVEAELRSEISSSSAKKMKDQYRLDPAKNILTDPGVLTTLSESSPLDTMVSGPDALISITKISTRTSRDEIKKLLREDPGREAHMRYHDFYTIIFVTRIRMEDSSTTRFVNAIMQFVFPPFVKILNYSPRERGIIPGLIKAGGTGIRSSPALDLTAVSFKGTGFPRILRKSGLNSYLVQTQKLPAYTAKNPGSIWEYPRPGCLNTWRCLKMTMKYMAKYIPPCRYSTVKVPAKKTSQFFP